MEFITISPEIQDAFLPLLTADVAAQLKEDPAVLAFGAVEEGKPCGVLVFLLEETQNRLLWICVDEEKQGQGIARAMVRAWLEKSYTDPAVRRLIADIPREERLHPLYPLLLTECWMPVPFALPAYRCTLGELAAQDFWKQDAQVSDVYPLTEIPATLLRDYSIRLEEEAESVPIDLPLRAEAYDPVTSLGYVRDNALQAVVLFQKEEDELVLEYAHAAQAGGAAFGKLVYAAGKRGMAHYPKEMYLSFGTLTETSRKLAEKLLPHANAQPMYRMILTLPANRKRGE